MEMTTAATGRQHGIHPQIVRNRFRQTVKPSVKFSSIDIGRQGTTGAEVICASGVLFADESRLTLAMPTDVRKFTTVGESVMLLRTSLRGAFSVLVWGWSMSGESLNRDNLKHQCPNLSNYQ